MAILTILLAILGAIALFLSFQAATAYLEERGYEIGFQSWFSIKAIEYLGLYRIETKKEKGRVGIPYYIFYVTLCLEIVTFLLLLNL